MYHKDIFGSLIECAAGLLSLRVIIRIVTKEVSNMLRQRIRSFVELLTISRPSMSNERSRLAAANSVDELRRLAHQRTPSFVFDYLEGGAGSEISIAENLAAFSRHFLTPSVSDSVENASLNTELFGVDYAMPIGIAPIGLSSLMRAEAESAGVRAAASRNVPFTLSTMGTRSVEEVAENAPRAHRWFQLYLRRNRDASARLIQRAAEAGFTTLVVTVDTRVPGRRLRDERNQLSMPPRLSGRTAFQAATKPVWTLDLLKHDAPSMANFGPEDGSISEVVGSMFDPALTVEDVRWLRSIWKGTLVVKGVLSAHDALNFVEAGADGIWVSNHGGRQLDRVVPSIDVISTIRQAVGDEIPIMLDSGVRTGVDAITALAAGADFVFLGRAYMYGLMAGGQAGAERALDVIAEEMLNALQLLGAVSPAQVRAQGNAILHGQSTIKTNFSAQDNVMSTN